PVLVVSDELAEQQHELERLLHTRVYRHPAVLEKRREAQAALRTMFEGYVARPELLPETFARRAASAGLPRTVGDYLAGMTDRFAMREFERLFAAPRGA